MINILIGFVLWPLSELVYITIWNLVCRIRKAHPMAYYEWYLSLFGIICLAIFDIFRNVKRAESYKGGGF